MRQKVLSSAYLRAVKDPFPPARQAGILAMSATHNYFTVPDIAYRLLPALALLTVDPEKSVRDQAFKAIKAFIGKLEKVSDNPELQADMGTFCFLFEDSKSLAGPKKGSFNLTHMNSQRYCKRLAVYLPRCCRCVCRERCEQRYPITGVVIRLGRVGRQRSVQPHQ